MSTSRDKSLKVGVFGWWWSSSHYGKPSFFFFPMTLTLCHVSVVISRAIGVQNNSEVKEKRKAAFSAFEYKVRKRTDALKLHCHILSSSFVSSLIHYIQHRVYMLFSLNDFYLCWYLLATNLRLHFDIPPPALLWCSVISPNYVTRYL